MSKKPSSEVINLLRSDAPLETIAAYVVNQSLGMSPKEGAKLAHDIAANRDFTAAMICIMAATGIRADVAQIYETYKGTITTPAALQAFNISSSRKDIEGSASFKALRSVGFIFALAAKDSNAVAKKIATRYGDPFGIMGSTGDQNKEAVRINTELSRAVSSEDRGFVQGAINEQSIKDFALETFNKMKAPVQEKSATAKSSTKV